jgi:hypothetical protein
MRMRHGNPSSVQRRTCLLRILPRNAWRRGGVFTAGGLWRPVCRQRGFLWRVVQLGGQLPRLLLGLVWRPGILRLMS